MKNTFTTFLALLLCNITLSQNLIPNGDFETFSTCPTAFSQLNLAVPWFEPSGLVNASDYFNSCYITPGGVNVPYSGGGYQPAHSGQGYCGIYLYYGGIINSREYIEVQTTSPLTANECYSFSMFVNLYNQSALTTDAIGVFFSDTATTSLPFPGIMPVNPQLVNITGNMPDTVSWMHVSGTYTALGGENYITIGNFFDDAFTPLINVNTSGFQNSYCFVEDVSLIPCSSAGMQDALSEKIQLFPNPVKDILYITLPGSADAYHDLRIFNSLGQQVRSSKRNFFKNSSCKLSVADLPAGVYSIKISYQKGVYTSKFIKQ